LTPVRVDWVFFAKANELLNSNANAARIMESFCMGRG